LKFSIMGLIDASASGQFKIGETTINGVAMISIIAALSGISAAACLVLLAFAPAITILAHELGGYQAATLAN